MPLPEKGKSDRPRVWISRLSWAGAGLVVAVAGAIGLIQSLRPTMAQAQAPVKPAKIDGDRAFAYLKTICALGPRPAGSDANNRQRALVAEHFKKCGAEVREQPFTARDPLKGGRVAMANLIGAWFPDRTDRVVICAHYDTRPYPDRDPDPARQRGTFLGANDGASGVAVLMEIANHLKDLPTPWGVDLVLLDGEELVYGSDAPIDSYFLGSKFFAKQYEADRRNRKIHWRYVYGLVLDMVGDRNLAIDQEQYSLELAPRLVREVWSVAQRLRAASFKSRAGTAVYDDHLALNDGGIPAIDIIDFDYPQWHTASDLPDYCSGKSLAEVGRVVTAWLALPKPRAKRR